MAIIPLRAYNREIEGLIDNGQLDEAVAHCRHILVTYPKHIATYRLLGKALLEQQRISDATDIFQRVLSSVPDDFIANVGMSIIREDENNLDSSIWHMELAYEAQPANVAIQDELRRLYGRRDGVQPPKVRLTRGALSRMYAKGGLYDQAVAELRAAIAEDPNRPDLQLLLAEMFFQTNQRVEAIDACVTILKKIPQCLEANRILSVSLPETDGSDAIKNYRQKVISMDPYYAFASPDSITSDQVPENAVNIERLDWKSGIQVPETPVQPSWATSLGISMDKPSEENIPDWLKTAEPPPSGSPAANSGPAVSPFIWDTQEVHNIITEPAKPESQLPGWMKDAGWQPASGEAPQAPVAPKPEEPTEETPPSEDLEKAEIPDWLQGMAPQGVLGEEKPGEPPAEGDLSTPWLEQHQPGPTDSIIHWLEDNKPEKPHTRASKEEAAAELSAEEMPDWLKDLEPTQPTTAPAGGTVAPTPAFTIEPSEVIEEMPQQPTDEGKTTPEVAPPTPAESALPGMPVQAESKAAGEEEIPDWLRELAGEELPITEAAPAENAHPAQTQEVSAFESGSESAFISQEVPASEAPSMVGEIPTPETPATAEPQPASLEAPVTEEAPSVEPGVIPEEQPAVEVPAAVEPAASTEPPTVAEELPVLEVPTAELPAPAEVIYAEVAPIPEGVPGAQVSTEPGIVGEEADLAKEIPQVEMPIEGEKMPESEPTPVVEGQPTMQPSIPPEQQPVEELPPAPEGLPEPTAGEAIAGEAGALAWLESLAAEHGEKEKPSPTVAEGGEIIPPEWVKLEAEPPLEESLEPESKPSEAKPVPAAEEPDWIKGLGEEPAAEQAQTEPEMEIPQGGELPDWLRELEEPEPEKGEAAPIPEGLAWKAEELPTWLKEITETMTPPETSAPLAETPPPAETPVLAETPPPAEIQVPAEITSAAEQPAPVEEPAPAQEAVLAQEPALAQEPMPENEPVPAQEPVLAETPEAITAPTTIEAPIPEEGVPAPTEPAIEWSSEVTPPAGIKREALVETPVESGAWVPEVQETVPPPATLQPEAQAPAPVSEELPPTTAAVEPATVQVEAPAEQADVSLETFQAISQTNQNKLVEARQSINQGLPGQAVESYNGLIKQNYHLDEIIKDLQDALYRYPVDVNLWVSLADAHFRTDNLEEALNAYTKAEELIR